MKSSKRKLRKKPGWYLIVLIVAAISFYGVVKSGQSLYKLFRMSRIKNTEEKALNEPLNRIEELELEVERLTNDMSYIEKIAREEYGMKKKGEEAFKISNPEKKSEEK
jgi:cell division protein FtsB